MSNKRQREDLQNIHTRVPRRDYKKIQEICDRLGITQAEYFNSLIIFRYTEDERVFPIQETSAIIDTEQKALEILEKRDYQGHIPDDMMDSVLGEEQPDNFFQ